MLRRRILASAMASVMAIGSVAVVANAETTAAATTQAKTKADLEAYVKSFDSFRSGKLNDYGSISGEKFMDAIEYAENVIADSKSTLDDYTVAYAMLEATYNKLKIYTAEELKALLDTNKKNYEGGNVYNEELGDPIFNEEKYATFEDAYENAEAYLNSSDSRSISDAYEVLEAAANDMGRYDVITKAQFRAALKEYEAMLQKEYAYDSWRVGTFGGWVDLTNGGFWGYNGQSITYGVLFDHLSSIKTVVNDAYEQMDEIKTLNKTSLPEIVKAYKACCDAVSLMGQWSADDTNRGSKANVQKLLDEYHGRLVYDFNTTKAEDLFDEVYAVATKNDDDGNPVVNLKVLVSINDSQSSKWLDLSKATDLADFATRVDAPWYVSTAKYTADPDLSGSGDTYIKLKEASISVKSGVSFYIPLDDDGYWNGASLTTTKPTGKYKMITKNVEVDLTQYIKVSLADVVANRNDVDLDNADKNSVLDGDFHGLKEIPWAAGTYFDLEDDKWAYEAIGQYGTIDYAEDIVFSGTRVNSDGDVNPTRTNLLTAFQLADTYLNGTKDDIAALTNPLYAIDTTKSVAEGSAKGSSTEWTLVYRYLRYALHDMYDTSLDLYTKADVQKLIDDAYQLAEDTGDSALFSIRHNQLVDARQYALDWLKSANKDKKYKDNFSAPEVNGVGKTSTDIYGYLKGFYDSLNEEYKRFKYSFDDIAIKISEVKSMIDDGDLQATDTLMTALEETAYRLSIVETLQDNDGNEMDSYAFTSDRYFAGYNRVYNGNDDNFEIATSVDAAGSITKTKIAKASENAAVASHQNLVTAYEALLAEVKAQTEVKTVVGDVNGDGVVNALDAAAILKAVAAGTAIDVAVGDYNADGVVNALDASAILKAVTQA